MSKQQRPRLLAIDWSGARRVGNSIAVAVMEPDTNSPMLLGPDGNLWTSASNRWTRESVLEFLREEAKHANSDRPVIVGIDFAFTLPFIDCSCYLKGLDIASASELWAEINEVCQTSEDCGAKYGYRGAEKFYAESFVDKYSEYFWREGHQPENLLLRYRASEYAAMARGLTPESVFKLRFSKQVGRGALAGMRVLHDLTQKCKTASRIVIWPFDKMNKRGLTVVEIYPALFKRAANVEVKNLEYYNDHQKDALVSAAGMAQILDSGRKNIWNPGKNSMMDEDTLNTEGWIFGVPWPEKGC